MNAIRVLLLDDSAICRSQLRAFLEAEGDIVVVGEAGDGQDVLRLIQKSQPQLLVVDLQMPHTDGHRTITEVMARDPRPILVVTGQPLGPGREAVFESVRRGALDLAQKPAGNEPDAQARLRQTVRRLAGLPVVRHMAGTRHGAVPTPESRTASRSPRPSVRPPALLQGDAPLVVGIGASAGGPTALASLLSALPASFRAAVLVVQHLPSSFTSAFVEFLSSKTALEVQAVEVPVRVRTGVVYVAPGDRHMGLRDALTVTPLSDAPRGGHCPSVDVLFESLTRQAGSRAAGVILSGIGQDGMSGLVALRERAGLCLAQDKASAAVWGMPKAAVESGAAEQALAPRDLARVLDTWARSEGRR